MKKVLPIILLIGLISCETNDKNTTIQTPLDNEELVVIYENDQADRKTANIDWSVISPRDKKRKIRLFEMLDSNLVRTAKDYHHAAMIFQHGGDSISYAMAVKLIKKSLELDSTSTMNKWLFAAATDRYLLSIGESQIYGTQYGKRHDDDVWRLRPLDSTKISDATRIEYGVETLAQQRDKMKRMNLKKLAEIYANGKSVADLITFIKGESSEVADFDVSERALNMFGYQLIGEDNKTDALQIFELNTKLYPEAFNTFDSYGECLLALGRKKEGLSAYAKSLELNPKNENARVILAENK